MSTQLDPAAIPFVQAKWFTATGGRAVDLIVIHDMEAPERDATAESTAAYFASGAGGRKASAHYNVDNNSIVQSVRDKDIAYHAPGANNNGIGIEHAGYARQTRQEWLDNYSFSMLAKSAHLAATLCDKYHLPVTYVDANGLLRKERGITTHRQVSLAFKKSTHTDPGPDFPMDVYLLLIRQSGPVAPPSAPTPVAPMYSPPLNVCAVWQDPATGAALAGVAPDGAVFAWGVPYRGGANGKPWFQGRTAAAIGPPLSPEKAYTITATSGETYQLPE